MLLVLHVLLIFRIISKDPIYLLHNLLSRDHLLFVSKFSHPLAAFCTHSFVYFFLLFEYLTQTTLQCNRFISFLLFSLPKISIFQLHHPLLGRGLLLVFRPEFDYFHTHSLEFLELFFELGCNCLLTFLQALQCNHELHLYTNQSIFLMILQFDFPKQVAVILICFHDLFC